MRRILSLMLSLTMALGFVPAVSAAGAPAGQISGLAISQTGAHLVGQIARVRSLDIGHVADVTTTTAAGQFSFTGLSAGSYVVELVSNGYVVGTSAPVTLTARDMTADGVTATAASAAQAQAGVLAGSFWTSTIGIITMAAITAGVVTAVVVVKNDSSPSQ
jgi:hypothetical protein